MSTTMEKVVQDALNVLGEVPGAGVSTYSEDRMLADAIRTFNLLFKKYHWPHMLEWFRVQLDGTNGVVPANTFQNVRDLEDFLSVHRDGQRNPLPVIPKSVNPYALQSGGGQVKYWSFMAVTNTLFENRYLQFYPKTTTEWVNVCARVYPKVNGQEWDMDDEVHLDHDMMVCGTAWHTLASDDINPGAQDAQRNMMEMRYKDILAALSNQPVVASSSNGIPTDWQVR